jgi:hypothetical protein
MCAPLPVISQNGNRQFETRNAGTMPYAYTPVGSNWLYQRGGDYRIRNLPPQMQCKKVCKAKARVCVGFVELEVSSSPDKWAGGYAGLRLIPGLSAQSGLECSIECGDPTGWNLKATATAGAGIGVTGNASIGFDGASTGGGLASGSIWGLSLPSPGVGYRF